MVNMNRAKSMFNLRVAGLKMYSTCPNKAALWSLNIKCQQAGVKKSQQPADKTQIA